MTECTAATRLVVRDARPSDYDAVRRLTLDVYVGERYSSSRYAEQLADVATRAASTEVLVATDGEHGAVLGAVALAARGGPYAELAGPGEAVFRMLAVAAQARGRGVGEALVRECLARAVAAGCHRMVISTQAEMAAAHRLYARLGFRRAPERDWSPEPGVDLLVLERDLP